MSPPPPPRCVPTCAHVRARRTCCPRAQARTAILSPTRSRCLALARSVSLSLAISLYHCSACAHFLTLSFSRRLSVSLFSFCFVSHPLPLSAAVFLLSRSLSLTLPVSPSLSFSNCLALSSLSFFLCLSVSLFLFISFFLSLSLFLSRFLSHTRTHPSLSLSPSLSFSSFFLFSLSFALFLLSLSVRCIRVIIHMRVRGASCKPGITRALVLNLLACISTSRWRSWRRQRQRRDLRLQEHAEGPPPHSAAQVVQQVELGLLLGRLPAQGPRPAHSRGCTRHCGPQTEGALCVRDVLPAWQGGARRGQEKPGWRRILRRSENS